MKDSNNTNTNTNTNINTNINITDLSLDDYIKIAELLGFETNSEYYIEKQHHINGICVFIKNNFTDTILVFVHLWSGTFDVFLKSKNNDGQYIDTRIPLSHLIIIIPELKRLTVIS